MWGASGRVHPCHGQSARRSRAGLHAAWASWPFHPLWANRTAVPRGFDSTRRFAVGAATGTRRGQHWAFRFRPTSTASPGHPFWPRISAASLQRILRAAILAAGCKPTIRPAILAAWSNPTIRDPFSAAGRFCAAVFGQPAPPVLSQPGTAAIGQAVGCGQIAGQPDGTRNGGIGWAAGFFRRLSPRRDVPGPPGRFGPRALEFPEPVVIRPAADLSRPEDGVFSRWRCGPDALGIFWCSGQWVDGPASTVRTRRNSSGFRCQDSGIAGRERSVESQQRSGVP